MKAFRVVLDIKSLNILDIGSIISNTIKDRYNKAENFMETIRCQLENSRFPREGAIYIANNIENAHAWYKKIDANQHLNYYIYKLDLNGRVQWHNAKYYENVFQLCFNQSIPLEIRFSEMRDNAIKYWMEEISPENVNSEGLFWECATILERKHYNYLQNEI